VKPGARLTVEVERTFESKLEEPYNPCLKDASKFKKNKTIIEYLHRKNQIYTQEECLGLCFDLFYIKDQPCECANAELGSVWKNCWVIKEKKNFSNSCTYNYKSDFQNSNNLVEKCSDYCPLECDRVSFSFKTSSFFYGLNKPNTTTVMVFYRTLKYISISQQAKTKPEQLVSNLGGYLGLFVGLSFISLFEIIEIIIEVAFIFTGKHTLIEPEIKQEI
jgi:hypothetical protein